MKSPGASQEEPENGAARLAAESPRGTGWRSSAGRNWIGAGLSVVALALLALAAYTAVGSARGMADAADAIARLRWWHVVVACGVPACNFFLTSLIFWLLTVRGLPLIAPGARGISYREMLALITSGTLLNQLPGKPGIVGRTLYHKFITGIPIRFTLLVMLQAIAIGGVGVLLCMAFAIAWAGIGWAAGAAGLAAMTLAAAWGCRGMLRSGLGHATLMHVGLVVMGIRVCETVLWSLRYWVMLDVAGRPVSVAEAAIIAAASQMAILLPIQVGLREWTVGIVLGLLPHAGQSNANGLLDSNGARIGLLADLLCRSADLAVMVPAGLVASWLVYRSIAVAQAGAGGLNRAIAGAEGLSDKKV